MQKINEKTQIFFSKLSFIQCTVGGWDKVAVEEVKKMATAKARHTGGEEGEAVRRMFTKLSVLLMRGNAAILANRIPAEDVGVGE